MPGRIQYLDSHDLDKEKWDQCLKQSSNGLIYGSGIYLDTMAENWSAIVVDDYQAIMPLPWRKKMFIPYYYRVPFLPQSGIFGTIEPALFREMTRTIFRKIKFGDIFLNYGNADYAKYLSARPLVNKVLNLRENYSNIAGRYHSAFLKSLKKAGRFNHMYVEGQDFQHVVALFKKHYGSGIASLNAKDYDKFSGLCLQLHQDNKAIIRKAMDANGRLLAAVLMLKDEHRLYNMMNIVQRDGRSGAANHFLYDQVIREFSGHDLVLDMEGSNLPGIREFYRYTGAENQPYFFYTRIPFVIRMLKGQT